MGLIPSLLTEMAPMTVECVILPLVLSLWFYSKSGLGGGVAATCVLFYHLLRVGYNFRNPLLGYTTSQEITDSNALYYRHFPLFIVASSIVGTMVGWLLDLRGMLPYYRLVGGTAGERLEVLTSNEKLKETIISFQNKYESDGYSAWGYKRIAAPYLHCIVVTLIFLWTVVLPFLLWGFIYPISKYAAFGSAGLVPISGYVALLIFSLKNTELGVWGPSKNNLKKRSREESHRKEDDDLKQDDPDYGENDSNGNNKFRDAVFERTTYTIWKNIVVIAAVHLLGFILVAGVVTFLTNPSINVPWIVGICYVLLLALVVVIASVIMYYNRSDDEDDTFFRRSRKQKSETVDLSTTDEEAEVPLSALSTAEQMKMRLMASSRLLKEQ